MFSNEFILSDRIDKIQQIINKYGEDNFYISFSGGRDSTVVSAIIDIALPNNKIPRVYADTGIEYNMIRDYVIRKASTDCRYVIIKPKTPIIEMLKKEGYPFKSKEHAAIVDIYQRHKDLNMKSVKKYIEKDNRYKCPDKLLYQFTDACKLRISDKCCERLKEQPLNKWSKENKKPFTILGIMRAEEGRRNRAECLVFRRDKLKAFQPLAPITKDFEEWFIDKYNIEICDIYKPPYNFKRTGCKGCPFNPYLQKALDTMEKYFPNELKQCEIIWSDVYKEYRRIGYRLKKEV